MVVVLVNNAAEIKTLSLMLRVAAAVALVVVAASAADIRPATDVHIEETKSYWTSVGVDIMADATGDPDKRNGLFVISGTLKNVSSTPLRVVMLEFTLVGKDGAVVYRRESFNRAAENLLDAEDAADATSIEATLVPIAPGATDSYRMIFIGEEIPAFDHPAVAVRGVR